MSAINTAIPWAATMPTARRCAPSAPRTSWQATCVGFHPPLAPDHPSGEPANERL